MKVIDLPQALPHLNLFYTDKDKFSPTSKKMIVKFSESAKKMLPKIEYTIVVFGKTGAGKSSLCNLIGNAKERQLAEYYGISSGTKELHAAKIYYKDSIITYIDTPGFGNNQGIDSTKIISSFSKLLRERGKGFHTIFYCINSQAHFDLNDLQNLTFLHDILGEECFSRLIPILTKADLYSSPEHLNDIIEKIKRSLKDNGLYKIQGNPVMISNKGNGFESEFDSIFTFIKENMNSKVIPKICNLNLQNSVTAFKEFTKSGELAYFLQKAYFEAEYKTNSLNDLEKRLQNWKLSLEAKLKESNQLKQIQDDLSQNEKNIISCKTSLTVTKKFRDRLKLLLSKNKWNKQDLEILKKTIEYENFSEKLRVYLNSTGSQNPEEKTLYQEIYDLISEFDKTDRDDKRSIRKSRYISNMCEYVEPKIKTLMERKICSLLKSPPDGIKLEFQPNIKQRLISPIKETLIWALKFASIIIIWREFINLEFGFHDSVNFGIYYLLTFVLLGIILFTWFELIWSRKATKKEALETYYDLIQEDQTYETIKKGVLKEYDDDVFFNQTREIVYLQNIIDIMEVIAKYNKKFYYFFPLIQPIYLKTNIQMNLILLTV